MSSHLVIVESPAKARTIKRFLGKDYIVEASMGHVRDLPASTLGVDVDKDFTPTYEVPDEKKTTVKHLKDALKKAETLWIATDTDREGEAIGWHLCEVLKVKNPEKIKRIVFHEITEEAIKHAISTPRTLDMRLVDAQQARRILDRLVGYTLSPFLWKKVYRGLSAGRVQSVAVRIIVDREREIQAFTPKEYWSIDAKLLTEKKEDFTAALQKKDGKKLEVGSEQEAKKILSELEGKEYSVADIEEKEVKKSPPAPFTTSTLQQEASRKLGFSVKQTMVIAQQLYEGVSLGKGKGSAGLITYMRTDSVNLSDKALADAKETIQKNFGREYILSTPRTYKTKSKGAQEAHEAIRPTELLRTPESVADILDTQQLKLYTLIWNRTVATQMPQAEFKRVGADITAGVYTFRATGQTLLFDGFLRVYREDHDEETAENDDSERILPPLTKGQKLDLDALDPQQHFTKPPARYTEASLVRKMEEEGIGRPSTYAPTISTIQQRGYIKKEGRNLLPEDVAYTVTDLLTEHFPDIVNLHFTATMEQSLDDIAEGEKESQGFLKNFFGPFKDLVDTKTKEIKKEDVMKEHIVGVDPDTGLEVIARLGRFGPYVQLGRVEEDEKGKKKGKASDLKTASLPKEVSVEKVTLEQALSLLSFPRNLGLHDGNEVTVSLGRFGPYVRCGKQTATLTQEDDPATITFDRCVVLITESAEKKKKAAEPLRELGEDPATGAKMLIKTGRFGPYVTDGKTNASISKKLDPMTITDDEAADLLAKKRARPKKSFGQAKGPGRRFGKKKA